MRSLLALCAVSYCVPAFAADPVAKPTAAQLEYFEAKVRPVLAAHCFSCHGPKKQEAGLRLDTAAGLKAGADVGPVVVPGDPAKSRLIKSVRREHELPMPPKTPLPPDAVAVLVEWVKTGAASPPRSRRGRTPTRRSTGPTNRSFDRKSQNSRPKSRTKSTRSSSRS